MLCTILLISSSDTTWPLAVRHKQLALVLTNVKTVLINVLHCYLVPPHGIVLSKGQQKPMRGFIRSTSEPSLKYY